MPSAYYVCYLKLCGCVSFDNMYVNTEETYIPYHSISRMRKPPMDRSFHCTGVGGRGRQPFNII